MSDNQTATPQRIWIEQSRDHWTDGSWQVIGTMNIGEEGEYNGVEYIRADSYEAMREALKGVPDPEDRGFCNSCSTVGQLPIATEMVKTKDGEYRRDFFKHDDSCWYGKVCAALAPVEGTETK